MAPADDQEMASPWASVMVIIVLLKLACTWATPEVMSFFSRRRTRVLSLALLYSRMCKLTQAESNARAALSGLPTFSCRRSVWPALYACAHWYGSSDRAQAIRGDDASPGSSRGPSNA